VHIQTVDGDSALRRNSHVIYKSLWTPGAKAFCVSWGLCSLLTPLQPENMAPCRQFVRCSKLRRILRDPFRVGTRSTTNKSCTMKFGLNLIRDKVFLLFVAFIFKDKDLIPERKLGTIFRCITGVLRFRKSLLCKRLLWENVLLCNLALVNVPLLLQRRVQLTRLERSRNLNLWSQLPYWTMLFLIYVNNRPGILNFCRRT
jgi:hypothetical protein